MANPAGPPSRANQVRALETGKFSAAKAAALDASTAAVLLVQVDYHGARRQSLEPFRPYGELELGATRGRRYV